MTRIAAPLLAVGAVAGLLAAPGPGRAHHGAASIGVAGAEGPGAALETASALPLPPGTLHTMAKSEYVPFEDATATGDKDWSLYSTLALGFGIRPWLSAYLFQPYSVKSTNGAGQNAGVADPSLMLAVGFKYDEGFLLVPEKESLDELEDWHFSVWSAATLPVAPSERVNSADGLPFTPDMQTGFGGPSASAGVAALKQLSPALTWQAEASYQHFFPHEYAFTRYQFGGETRASAAVVYRAWAAGRFRLDASGELNGLHLQRDQEWSDASGRMESLSASGGAILYAGAGLRLGHGAWSASLGARRPVLKRLNEEPEQQGAEGLERFRAAFTVSYSTGF